MLLIVIAVVLGFAFLLVIGTKHRSMLTGRGRLEGNQLAGGRLDAPQIILSSYRKTGKVPELEPIEAAVLMGVPLNRRPGSRAGHDAGQRGGAPARRRDRRSDQPRVQT